MRGKLAHRVGRTPVFEGLSQRVFIGFAALILSLLPAGLRSQSPAPETEKTFQAAMAAEDRGDLATAESLLRGLHASHPGIFVIDESLGLLYVQQENFEAAQRLLKAAAAEQPNSDAGHANLGAALYRLHRDKEALAEFQTAVRLNPNNADTQESLGRLLMEQHRPAEAADAFATAVKVNPDRAGLILDRAQALIEADQPETALSELKAMPDVEQSASAQLLLGDAEEKLGSFQRAAEHYARAVELDPTESNVWALGVEFLRHWTFDPAVKEFEAAAAKFPNSTRIKLGLGAAYFGDAKYAESIPVFADLLGADPNNALYAELLGMACTAVTESNKQRCSALVDFAQAHPRNARVSTYAASMLLTESGDSDRTALADKLLTNALAVDPRSADAHYEMGLLKQNQGDWVGSVPSLEKAIAIKSDLAPAHYRLALAYWRTGHKQEGQAEIELQKKYSKQEKEDMDRRLRQITTFIVDVRQ
jgi:tetratricopeptide (TPR) repeat protein